MVKVVFTADAKRELAGIPTVIRLRCYDVLKRLGNWPNVSGAKPLRKEFKGHFRIRTGDYRIVFKPEGSTVWIIRIDNRKDVYER